MSTGVPRHRRHVVELTSPLAAEVTRTGGKGAGLARLMAEGFRVPAGFVVTTEAFRTSTQNLEQRIDDSLTGRDSPDADAEASERIQRLFAEAAIPAEVAAEIVEAYERLGNSGVPVAVRSSSVAEDTEAASFAGQQDTYLWIRGADELLGHVMRCWASLFTPRAIAYRRRFGVPLGDIAMAVVVQEMVPAECAGVMMTLEPTTGNGDDVYIESAFGLGETVVRGDVSPDCFIVDKRRGRIRSKLIGSKAEAHRFDETSGTVRRVRVSGEEANNPTLSDDEILHLARLAVQAQRRFGGHLELEWAVGLRPGVGREIFLLQCRPETVWSKRPSADIPPPDDLVDPLMDTSTPNLHWSRSNVGEAVPGVLTPLNWSIWGGVGERSVRESGYAVGALSAGEARMPEDPDERAVRVFHGRYTVNVEFVAQLGDRLPGVTAQDIVTSILGGVPATMRFSPTRRRYPIVAWKAGRIFLTYPRVASRLARDYDDWWRQSIDAAAYLDRSDAVELLREGVRRIGEALTLQTTGLLVVIQPVYELLERIAASAGTGDVAELSGSGHSEIAVISDIWRVSRGMSTIDDLKRKHGFHGPLEGEIASRVWRQDDTPLRRMVEHYGNKADSENPARAESERARRREQSTHAILATFPIRHRLLVRLALRLGRTRMPLRGLVKRSFLQALDVSRAAACRLGELLVADGVLDTVDDVFFLDIDELMTSQNSNLKARVAQRRRYWHQHKAVVVPGEWTGIPEVRRKDAEERHSDSLAGVGVSPGLVEGRARVLMEPDFVEVEPGEILVAPHTDPSWSSVMFISSGLVVDIGGALSHAAVVARELGIPCVVNTRTGTRDIKTGDLIRVDGARGTVDVIAADQPITVAEAVVHTPRRSTRSEAGSGSMKDIEARTNTGQWGFLAEPVHSQVPPDALLTSSASWRDNAFLAFWDVGNAVFGTVHVSTSPNSDGRRARCSVLAGGRQAEVVEELEPGSFTSKSIHFDMEGARIAVKSDGLDVDMVMAPRFVAVDYQSGAIPELVPGHGLRHFEQGAHVSGEIRVGDVTLAIDGHGYRDRTWGPRDESAAMPEYAAVLACMPEFNVSLAKFRHNDGAIRSGGYLLHEDRTEAVSDVEFVRDARGLIDGASATRRDGRTIRFRMRRTRGGFWLPMGVGGPPPTMSAYDDSVDIWIEDSPVQRGAGFTEQGVVRRL